MPFGYIGTDIETCRTIRSMGGCSSIFTIVLVTYYPFASCRNSSYGLLCSSFAFVPLLLLVVVLLSACVVPEPSVNTAGGSLTYECVPTRDSVFR